MNSHQSGTLFIVATPVGNLKDMVPRAVETLQSVSVIACEDTRHSKKLLEHFNIDTPCISYHDHTDQKATEKIINRLSHGKSVALISDAGTPLISDPGYRLVAEARKRKLEVIPIPGACAAISALSVSGLATDKFRFIGFLPSKSSQRTKVLETLKSASDTLIFYEAPHRVLAMLEDVSMVFGPHRIAFLAREISKTFETYLHGSLESLSVKVGNDSNQQRGEIVLIVSGNGILKESLSIEAKRILKLLMKELPIAKASALTAKITGDEKQELYQLALRLQNK
jgi:16S rRNA (cytidine1402-2'-O)-methyltransferase